MVCGASAILLRIIFIYFFCISTIMLQTLKSDKRHRLSSVRGTAHARHSGSTQSGASVESLKTDSWK